MSDGAPRCSHSDSCCRQQRHVRTGGTLPPFVRPAAAIESARGVRCITDEPAMRWTAAAARTEGQRAHCTESEAQPRTPKRCGEVRLRGRRAWPVAAAIRSTQRRQAEPGCAPHTGRETTEAWSRHTTTHRTAAPPLCEQRPLRTARKTRQSILRLSKFASTKMHAVACMHSIDDTKS